MGSLANSPWRGVELKAPAVLALAVLAVAAWKASYYKAYQGDDNNHPPPENADDKSPPRSGSSTGARRGDREGRSRRRSSVSSDSNTQGTRSRSSSKNNGSVNIGCRCNCHDENINKAGGRDAGSGPGGGNTNEQKHNRGNDQVGAATTTASAPVSNNADGASKPNSSTSKSCCECVGNHHSSSTAYRRRGTADSKSNGGGSTHHQRRRSGTSRQGSYGRSRGRERSSSGGGGYGRAGGLGRAAAATAAAAARSAGLKADPKGAGGVDEKEKGEESVTVDSTVTLQRMCYLPGVVLRSGLVYQRVTALALPGQGLRDGDIPANLARLVGMLRKVNLSCNKLTGVPRGLLQLGGGLEDLNLGNNRIKELPTEIADLPGLISLNLAGNRLSKLPSEAGHLPALKRLGLKGNALVHLPSSLGDLSHLVELYLTGNKLEELPAEIVKLRRLRKLQLSFNNLRSLPSGMEGMRSLELCRLAVNPELAVVPEGLAFAERLSWVSLAGSAWCARATAKRRRNSFPQIERDDVELLERLGSGASGDVFAAIYQGRDVAVKVFRAEFGPDGSAQDELDIACVMDHPNLTSALGVVHGPDQQWLVMEKVPGKPLADKPDFSSVLRCRWGAGRRFEPVLVLAVLLQVARAMSYLHESGICHGDLYAHNVLVDGETGAAVLCDFGASFFYPSERDGHHSFALEGTEVRAFGLLARDMARRSAGCEWILQDLVPTCLQSDAGHRPSFHEIVNQLHAELMQSVEPSSPMVTSAKSLHSLLDRPDMAAERGRQRSEERRKETSAGSGGSGGFGSVPASSMPDTKVVPTSIHQIFEKQQATRNVSHAPTGGNHRTTDSVARGGVGYSKRVPSGLGLGGGPTTILGGVLEGTVDDEAGGGEESEGAGGGGGQGGVGGGVSAPGVLVEE